jgi:hypothetical protein
MRNKSVGISALFAALLLAVPVFGQPSNSDWPAQDWAPAADHQTVVPVQSEVEQPVSSQVAPPPIVAAPQSRLPAAEHHETSTVSESVDGQMRWQPIETPAEAISDFNREIYYKNKFEFATEVGVLPFNTPMLVGPLFGYKFARPHKRQAAFYTLVPAIFMLRWHLYNPRGPWFLRGNTEFLIGAQFTGMPEGRESMFTGPLAGVRYNFIQPNWKLVPYADLRFGLGYTNANQPWQVAHNLRADG